MYRNKVHVLKFLGKITKRTTITIKFVKHVNHHNRHTRCHKLNHGVFQKFCILEYIGYTPKQYM